MSRPAESIGEGAGLLGRVEAALAPLHAAVAPDCLRLGDAQIQIERSQPADGSLLHWSVADSGRAGLRVVAWFSEQDDPRPSVRVTLTYVVADPLSGKPALLDDARARNVAQLRG